MNNHKQSVAAGFTLIELVIVLTIVSITLSIGVPSFQGFIKSSRVAGLTNQFVTSVNYARSEAVKRGSRVTVCKSANQSTCTAGGDWDQGWMVFVDTANFGVWDAGEEIVRVQEDFEGATTLKVVSGVGSALSFLPRGRLVTGQSGQLSLCDNHEARTININAVGRTHIVEATC